MWFNSYTCSYCFLVISFSTYLNPDSIGLYEQIILYESRCVVDHFLRAIYSTKVATNCKYVAGVMCCNNCTNISSDVRRTCNYFLCTYIVFNKLMYFVCSSLIRFLQSNIFLTYCSGSDIVFCNFPKTFLVKIHPKYG